MCPCRAGTARRSCWTKTSGVSARRSSFTDETVEFGHLQDRLDQQGVDVDADSDAYVRPHVGRVSCEHAHHGCGARLLHANPVCGEFKANPMWAMAIWRDSSDVRPDHHCVSPVLAQPRGSHRVCCGLGYGRAWGDSADRPAGLQRGRQRRLQLGCDRGDMGGVHLPWSRPGST